MEFFLSFKVNESIYLRDPEGSELGKKIVKHAIDLIFKEGFENFTFKKLAVASNTTEASVYRYFENKHRLLLYILNWYWCYMEYLVHFQLQNMTNSKLKLEMIIDLFTQNLPQGSSDVEYNKFHLNEIIISESSKVYLVKEVSEINKNQVFKPYKDLCATIAMVISEYNPLYEFPRSLSSCLIETAHSQQFFCNNLPKLTDSTAENNKLFTNGFLKDLIFKALQE